MPYTISAAVTDISSLCDVECQGKLKVKHPSMNEDQAEPSERLSTDVKSLNNTVCLWVMHHIACSL